MGKLTVECEVGKVSDGYHTFDELYEHRCTLFIALMKANPDLSWFSHKHDDGFIWEGWFVTGIDLPSGTITYHVPDSMKDLLVYSGAKELDKGKPWDGHTATDVLKRLREWIKI